MRLSGRTCFWLQSGRYLLLAGSTTRRCCCCCCRPSHRARIDCALTQSHSFTQDRQTDRQQHEHALIQSVIHAEFTPSPYRSQTMSSAVRPPAAAVCTLPLSSSSSCTVWTASWIVVLVVCTSPVVAVAAITSQMSPRVVETQYGRLRGVLVSIADSTSAGQPAHRVEVYLGLQYASLLGGQLRFMPPTGPMEKWDGVRVALKHRPVCPQPAPNLDEPGLTDRERARRKRQAAFVEKQQEDCLTLNIYVPVTGQTQAALIGGR